MFESPSQHKFCWVDYGIGQLWWSAVCALQFLPVCLLKPKARILVVKAVKIWDCFCKAHSRVQASWLYVFAPRPKTPMMRRVPDCWLMRLLPMTWLREIRQRVTWEGFPQVHLSAFLGSAISWGFQRTVGRKKSAPLHLEAKIYFTLLSQLHDAAFRTLTKKKENRYLVYNPFGSIIQL